MPCSSQGLYQMVLDSVTLVTGILMVYARIFRYRYHGLVSRCTSLNHLCLIQFVVCNQENSFLFKMTGHVQIIAFLENRCE
jgi:hypothetical protein